MSNNTAKLVDASAIGSYGNGVSATLARAEFEEALKAGHGPVELSLDVKRLSGEQPDVEAHTLDIALERRDLKKLLKKSDGDAITLTFHEDELIEALGGDDDVEAHGVRERALVLTVAAATAAAGTGAYVASTAGHHTSGPTQTYAQQVSAAATGGYLTTAAANALGVAVQPVSDSATGGYIAPTIDTTIQAVPPIDAGSSLPNPALIPEQVSDAASSGGYQAGDQTYSAGAPGGYLSSETAQVISGSAQAPETTSDAASGGGYGSQASEAQGVSAASTGGYVTAAQGKAIAGAEAQGVSEASTGGYGSQPSEAPGVSAASTGGYVTAAQGKAIADSQAQGASAASTGYEAPTPRSGPVSDATAAEVLADEALTVQPISDAATGGYTQSDQSDALSRYVANQTPEQVSDAASSGPVTDQSDALSRYVANTQAGPEQVSDAATGGGYPATRAEAQRTSVTLPEAVGAAIAGGAALLITGVALQRRR